MNRREFLKLAGTLPLSLFAPRLMRDVRLQDGRCRTIFTALTELRGFEEKAGASRETGVEHGAIAARRAWSDERDEERQFGVTIPMHGWTLDVDNFRTHARNFFDHNPVGSSNVFFPLTIDRARIRGTEATIRSPRLLSRAQVHLAYSHQYAEGFGAVNGGLTDFSPGEESFFLDHDQRHTLSTGFDVNLPQHSWANGNIYYGSGFTDGEGPGHLPGHTTVDLALGKSIGENLSVTVTALNLANRRFLLDNSMTFAGGAHFFHPREIFAQVKYRFSY